jgi:hypothetical protein
VPPGYPINAEEIELKEKENATFLSVALCLGILSIEVAL